MYNDSYAYKVKQLIAMRDYERQAEPGEHYGAHLTHWSGHGNPINIDADALNALIGYYCDRDEREHQTTEPKEQSRPVLYNGYLIVFNDKFACWIIYDENGDKVREPCWGTVWEAKTAISNGEAL